MKKFHSYTDDSYTETMTVGELKAALDEYPDSMPVLSFRIEEVHGYVYTEVRPEHLKVEALGEFSLGKKWDSEDVLLIDVNEN